MRTQSVLDAAGQSIRSGASVEVPDPTVAAEGGLTPERGGDTVTPSSN